MPLLSLFFNRQHRSFTTLAHLLLVYSFTSSRSVYYYYRWHHRHREWHHLYHSYRYITAQAQRNIVASTEWRRINDELGCTSIYLKRERCPFRYWLASSPPGQSTKKKDIHRKTHAVKASHACVQKHACIYNIHVLTNSSPFFFSSDFFKLSKFLFLLFKTLLMLFSLYIASTVFSSFFFWLLLDLKILKMQ